VEIKIEIICKLSFWVSNQRYDNGIFRIDQFLIMINDRIINISDFKFKTHAQKSIFMNVENKVTRCLRVW